MRAAVRAKKRKSTSGTGRRGRADGVTRMRKLRRVFIKRIGRKSHRKVTYRHRIRSIRNKSPGLTAGSFGQRLLLIARNAGERFGRDHPIPVETRSKAWLQSLWGIFWHSTEAARIPRSAYREAADAFCQGYRSSCPLPDAAFVLLPTRRTVGAIVTAMNEERTLPGVLEQLKRLPLDETIIIVNGSTDRTLEIARKMEEAIVLHYMDPLGHDVGRAIGAKLSNAEIVLFLDGDFAVEAEQLVKFVNAIDSGVDVALNDLSPYMGKFRSRNNVTIVKEFLNRVLGRPDLLASSLTAVPHALSRHAIQTIGYRELMVPPKAHALAISSGLRVKASVSVDVVSRNKMLKHNVGSLNPVGRLIIGDHIEALQTLMKSKGSRLGLKDAIRRRIKAASQ